MTTSTHLLRRRRFLPLFVTQLFNAFNDNLYKTAMVLFVVYSVYNSEADESMFSGIASLVFILPFCLFSALAGQLADTNDKAKIIRRVKICEIVLMCIGAVGLYLAWQGIMVESVAIPVMLFALFLAALQSTFLGPIKYAILPQHLKKEEVLSGTGLVEAGTYIAILAGTTLAGWIPVEWAIIGILVTAVIGYLVSRHIPDAPPSGHQELHLPLLEPFWKNTNNPLLKYGALLPVAIADQIVMSWRLVRDTMHNREVYFAILAISFFWTIGAVLFIQFPPLAKNQLSASPQVASLFLVIFSVGIAIGSVAINALLKGKVSARYSPPSVIIMGFFVVGFYLVARMWSAEQGGSLIEVDEFIAQPLAIPLLAMLLGIAVAGGCFVVPLYAFLTTRVSSDRAARTVAANNIVNSIAMVLGSVLAIGVTAIGVGINEQLLMSAGMCLVSAWLGRKLYSAERDAAADAQLA
jgi:predicted MFS family arabinose efflux permease